ncbi:hypothetical protein [Roseimicrobium gellanilyticum]|nr:hypothetical protein [Roseimicrobium gellanilyticum]
MSTDNYLRRADVIGKSIQKIWYLDRPRTGRFQDRRMWVELSTGMGFDLMQILERTPDGFSLLRQTRRAEHMYCSKNQENEPRLRAEILAICESEMWLGFGVLLSNGFVVTAGISEWDTTVGIYVAGGEDASELVLPP